MARRIRRRTFADETWTIPPPAEVITPEVARRWLHRSYPPLARLGNLCAYPEIVHGLGRRELNERAASGLRLLALDVRMIAEACGKVLATGRSVPMRLDANSRVNHRGVARQIRAVLLFEARHPHRGARGLLQRGLREWERVTAEA